MAIVTTVDKQTVFGDLKVVVGHVFLDGVTTGEMDLSPYFSGRILSVVLGQQQVKTTPTNEVPPVMNETFPLDSSTAVTINGYSGVKATFIAVGEGV